MAEEPLIKVSTFQEVMAAKGGLGDPFGGTPPAEGNEPPATPPPAGGEPPATPPGEGTPPATPPPAGGEPVNWEAKYKEFETKYNTEKQQYEKDVSDYKTKITEFEKKPPPITHKDSDLSRLEVVKETAPDKFALFTKLLWGNPDAADLWKMDFVEKNPKYKDNPEMVQMMLEAEFKDYFDQDADKDSREYKIAAAKFEIAGEQIRAAKLKEFKDIPVSDPQDVAKQANEKKEALAKSWEIPFAEMSKSPLKVSNKVVLDDKSEVQVDFDLSPEDNKKYTDLMGLYILHNNLTPGAENAQKAKGFAMREILADKGWDIFKATLQKEKQRLWDEFQRLRNNNSPIPPSPVISADGKESAEDQIARNIREGKVYVPGAM